MERSVAPNAEMPAIPDLEGSAYLVVPPPPRSPDEATESHLHQPPKHIQAPPTELEGSRSCFRVRDRSAQWGRRAWHRRTHERVSRPSERRMAAHWTFPPCKRWVPACGSQSPWIRRLLSPWIRPGGLSPTGIRIRPLTRGPAPTFSPQSVCLFRVRITARGGEKPCMGSKLHAAPTALILIIFTLTLSIT